MAAPDRDWLAEKVRADVEARLDKLLALDPDRLEALMELEAADVRDLKDAIVFGRSARLLGRVGRMVFLAAVGAVTTAVLAGEKIGIAWGWMKGTWR